MIDRTPDETSPHSRADLTPIYQSAVLVLTWGFRVAAALLGVGLVLQAIQGDGLSTSARPIPEIFDLLLDGESRALVDLAIVAMILTPVAAVVAIAAGFARIGDRRYTIASLVVLVILGISITVSLLK